MQPSRDGLKGTIEVFIEAVGMDNGRPSYTARVDGRIVHEGPEPHSGAAAALYQGPGDDRRIKTFVLSDSRQWQMVHSDTLFQLAALKCR